MSRSARQTSPARPSSRSPGRGASRSPGAFPALRLPRLSALVALVPLVAAVAAGCGGAAPARPNGILVLLVDCLRFDHLEGAASAAPRAGAKRGVSPNLDRIAADGVSFTRAFAQASWTRPSVPSLFTGLYPSEHGLVDFVESGDRVSGNVLSEDAVTLAEGMQAAGYWTALVGYQSQLSVRFGLAQGFDNYNNNTLTAERIVNRFLGWLDEHPDRPYFAYLHFLDIHWPYCPPPATFGRLGPKPPETIDFCREWRKLRDRIHSGEVVLTAQDRAALAARYGEDLMALDGEIGRLVAELGKRGRWAETLVVVTADHGEELGERGGIEHGHSMYDELLHVPFVVRPPTSWGGRRGRFDDGLTETRSLLPTLFSLVGQPVPAAATGRDLMSRILGRRDRAEPLAASFAEANGMFAVRTAEWKLVIEPAKGTSRLYDLGADPGETTDVAANHPDELARLQSLFRRWRVGLKPLATGQVVLDDETRKGLEALGYL